MDDNGEINKRESGIYYTPHALADFLVKSLIESSELKILDPSYGEGSLLLAAERAVKSKELNLSALKLFGCDTKPVNGLLKHLPEANLKNIDFFDYPILNLFDLILMNPPYVRHQLQKNESVERYRSKLPELSHLNFSSDLWCYFIGKATGHLRNGGHIGAILPWAFLQADYAKPLRNWLAQKFESIRVLALNEKFFEEAEERIVLLWLKNYGTDSKTIEIASAKNLTDDLAFTRISLNEWNSDRVCYVGTHDSRQILTQYEEQFGFTKLMTHADIRIGVVTGADEFFIKSLQDAKAYGISKNHLTPILTTTKEFPDILNGRYNNLKSLVTIKERQSEKYKKYLSKGKKENYHMRAHSQLRNPWYAVNAGRIPDAFFPYRTSKYPFLLMNDKNVQCTNSIHRVYFRNLTKTEIKWVFVSLLSNIGQLSLEVTSKTYGRGMLKVEPKSLKNALIVVRNDKRINQPYSEIMRLLKVNKRQEAMCCATQFINEVFNISDTLTNSCSNMLAEFQKFRQ